MESRCTSRRITSSHGIANPSESNQKEPKDTPMKHLDFR
jgi:hypothetical protein